MLLSPTYETLKASTVARTSFFHDNTPGSGNPIFSRINANGWVDVALSRTMSLIGLDVPRNSVYAQPSFSFSISDVFKKAPK